MKKIKLGCVYTKKELDDLGFVPLDAVSSKLCIYKRYDKLYILRRLNPNKFRIDAKWTEVDK